LLVFAICMLLFGGIVSSLETPSKNKCNRICDVNRDGRINFQDAGLCHVYIQDEVDDYYGNLLYDVNIDGIVDNMDVMFIWNNRD